MDGPVHNPLEMNTNWSNITDYVQSVQRYRSQFNDYFGGVITDRTIKEALVAFMSALNTPDSPLTYISKDKLMLCGLLLSKVGKSSNLWVV